MTTEPTPAKKTKHISAISLHREFVVYDRSHARRNTKIWIHRRADDGKMCDAKQFETAPIIRAQGKISDASVLRAKRAQNLMLAAIAQQGDDE